MCSTPYLTVLCTISLCQSGSKQENSLPCLLVEGPLTKFESILCPCLKCKNAEHSTQGLKYEVIFLRLIAIKRLHLINLIMLGESSFEPEADALTAAASGEAESGQVDVEESDSD